MISRICMLFIFVFASSFLMAQTSQGPIAREVALTLEKGAFPVVFPFSEGVSAAEEDGRIAGVLSRGTLLELEPEVLAQILEQGPEALRVVIPKAAGPALVLDVVASSPFAEGFSVFAASDQEEPVAVELGRYYRGIISGQEHTLAAVSFHPDEVRAVIGTGQGDLVVGKMLDDRGNGHILYNDVDLLVTPEGECGTDNLPPLPHDRPSHEPMPGVRVTSNTVNVYVEIDNDIYQDKGSLQACLSFMAGLFHEVATLYANDTISVAMSEVLVWDVTSPYSCSSSGTCLNQFATETGTSYNGDAAHLVSYQASGGVAYVDQLCNSYWVNEYTKAFSSVNPTVYPVPTYSWSVEVFAHEMGHNLGSQHTHDCVWNGNYTAIDGCGPAAGYSSDPGGCAQGPIPAGGGTIMSYCHLGSNPGIDLSLGFGPQPKALIQSRVDGASCLGTYSGFVDTFYCHASGNSSSDLWISSVTVDTFVNASSSKTYSDFTNIGPAGYPGTTLSITLTPDDDNPSGDYVSYFAIYIDFNQDKDFEDTGEEVYLSGYGGGTRNGTISIPSTAITGSTRMRVIMSYSAVSSGCQNFPFGEVEDYTFTVNGQNCSVSDTVPPTARCQDITTCLDASGNAVISTGQIDNGSDDFCDESPSLSLSQSAFDCSHLGSNSVQLFVVDDSTNADTCVAMVTIEDCTVPVVSCSDLTLCLDAFGDTTITVPLVNGLATDACDPSPAMVLSTTAFTCNDLGSNPVLLVTTDNSGNADTCNVTVTITDCTAPTANCQDVTVCLDASGSGTLFPAQVDNSSADVCDNTLTLSLSQTAFSCVDLGQQSVILTVEDDAGLSDTCSATVTVQDCMAPVVSCQDVTLCLSSTGDTTLTVALINGTATDACDPTPVTTLTPTAFTCNELGENTALLISEDNAGNADTCTATVTIEDCTAPTAFCQDITACLDGSGNATITPTHINNSSTDICDASPTLSLSQEAFTCANLGTNSVQMTVEDQGGNTATCAATVTIEDCNAPIASCQDITLCLDASGNATLTASQLDDNSTDACTASLTLSTDISAFTCADLGENAVNLFVQDDASNADTCQSTVTIQDCAPPVAQCLDVTACLNANGTVSIDPLLLNDNSYDACDQNVAVSHESSAFTCEDIGQQIINLIAEDDAGNTDTCQATVTVENCNELIALCRDTTVCLDAEGQITITAQHVDNGSAESCNPSPSLSIDISTFDCDDLGSNFVQLTVEDGTGNTSACVSTVTIEDCLSSCESGPVTCPDTLTLTDDPLLTGSWQAGMLLTATGTVPSPEDVMLTAGQTVILSPGFHAQAGSALHVLIDTCQVADESLPSDFQITAREAENAPFAATAPATPLLAIFPNPFSHSATVRYSVPEAVENLSITLFDLTGQSVRAITPPTRVDAGVYEERFEASGLSPGFYFLRLSGQGMHVTEKVMIGQ